MPIQVLPESVINQIAAGEVVDRPAHLIKELIENSIDAHADEIIIKFQNGGQQVQIQDNGCGIDKNELRLALTRHATSKISQAQDLWKLKSFGFRGEALASIASVSAMKIISKTKESLFAYQLSCHFGDISELEKTQAPIGTKVIIDQLFANIPARKKFLKSNAAEVSQIKVVLKAIAMAHPEVSFQCSYEESWSVFWPKTSDKLSRIQAVMEMNELYENTYSSGEWKANVIIASPHHVASNSRQIWTFVNSRYVQDKGMQFAALEAYRSFLMHGEYPIVSIFLTGPAQDIDVNVHPTKSQVKFRDASVVFRVVHKAMRDILESAPWVKDIVRPNEANTNPIESLSMDPSGNISFNDPSFQKSQFYQRSPAELYNSNPNILINERSESKWLSLDIVGQLLNTYIVTQNQNGAVLIDQHAAHERVIFEKLMADWKKGQFETQQLLIPISIDLSEAEVEALSTQTQVLKKIGIEIDIVGPISIGVRTLPALLTDESIVVSLKKMAEQIAEFGQDYSVEKQIAEVFASLSCHSAIRAGKALTKDEMLALLRQMDEYPMSSFCPHGRPVSVEISSYELEKRFGRIV